jgi:ABC-type branched-subunit amino acid transport system substrate-binding protein
MVRRLLLLTLALTVTACSRPKVKVGLNVGAAGADVGAMAASAIRQSQAAKDRRFEVRVAAQRAVSSQQATPQMIKASLDSIGRDEKVAVVVSRFLDQEALDAAHQFKAERIPFLSVTPLPAGTATAQGPAFALVPGYDKQAQFMAEQAAKDDRVAIVHINDAYGVTLTNALTEALKARGIVPVDTRKYEQSWDEPRVMAVGRELDRDKHPTLLFFIGRAPSLQLVWQPFREGFKEIRVIGSDLVESTSLYVNPEAIFTGLKYVRYADPQSAEPRMKDLHDRYMMWISRGEMTSESALVYDAMMMTGEALRSGARTREQFQQYFASLGRTRPPFDGVTGPIAFTDGGAVARKFHLAEVTNQGVVAVNQ